MPNETTATANTITSVHNRTADLLSQDNLRYTPQSSYYSLIRFAMAPPSNEPYYARAMTEVRLSHAEEIKNQIHEVDRIFQVQGIDREQ